MLTARRFAIWTTLLWTASCTSYATETEVAICDVWNKTLFVSQPEDRREVREVEAIQRLTWQEVCG